ncbi:hypothetical protein TI05_11540 [Achromatium sp. WMS3]|nr:hypothetical protein TI05_11540 [Achromatium sp. WMS3]
MTHEGVTSGFNIYIAGIATILGITAIGLSWLLYGKNPLGPIDPLKKLLGSIFMGMERKWLVDELYETIFIKPYNWLAKILLGKYTDRGLINGFFDGLGSIIVLLSGLVRKTQTGQIRSYALTFVLGIVLVLSYFRC